jgi:hypothetical protein
MADANKEECVELTAPTTAEADTETPVENSTLNQSNISINYSSWIEKYNQWQSQKYKLPPHYKLSTEENSSKYSLWSVNFMILASALNTKMLNPNFAMMCAPGAHPDSFPSTEPFGFNSATYFLPGTLSDRYG